VAGEGDWGTSATVPCKRGEAAATDWNGSGGVHAVETFGRRWALGALMAVDRSGAPRTGSVDGNEGGSESCQGATDDGVECGGRATSAAATSVCHDGVCHPPHTPEY
jgi:hypothetical protein